MKKILLSVLCLFSIIAVHADEVTFDFTNPTGLTPSISDALFEDAGNGALAFATSETTFTQSGITLNTTNGSTVSRIWKSAKGVYDLRVYKTATMTIAAPAGSSISSIVFAGSSVSDFSADVGTIDGKTWTGNAQEVTFTWASGASTQKINTITVTYTAAVSGATLEDPAASVESGIIYNPTNIELSASDGEIHYTLDGTEPTAESPVYSEAIAVNEFGKTVTIKAVAIDGEEYSNTVTFSYNLQVATPAFSKEPGVYEKINYSSGYLVISSETTDAKINYTSNGTDPITNMAYYVVAGSKNATVSITSTIKAVAFIVTEAGDSIFSDVKTGTYTISTIEPFKAVSAIESGKKYLINTGDIIATGEYKSYYIKTTNVEKANNHIKTFACYAFTFTETEGEGKYTIQDSNGNYLYMKGTYNSYNTSTEAIEGDSALWTVTFNDDNTATITNVGKGKTMQYDEKYNTYGAYASITHTLPTLFEQTEYPTMTISPESWSEVTAFPTITVTCESGIALNESDVLGATYRIGWDYTYYDLYGEVSADGKTVTFTPADAPSGSNDYTVIFPKGLFTLDPNGVASTSEEEEISFTVKDPNALEVTYEYIENYANVHELSILYFEYSQDIFDNVSGAAIVGEDGTEYPLTVSYDTDPWGGKPGYNALSLVLAEPITTPGWYTFTLKSTYASSETGAQISEDIFYEFQITEPMKITSVTPANNATVESLSEILITFNYTMVYPGGDYCTVWGPNGEEYLFSVVGEDAEGYELPAGTWRLVPDAPLTAAGEYVLYLEDSFFTGYPGPEYSSPQMFTFYVESSAITGDLNSDSSVDVADLTMLVSMILDSSKIADAADLNGDGSVDVADLTSLVSIILGTDTATEAPAKAAATRAGSLPVISAEGDGSDLLINVSNPDFPFTAIQFDIYLPEELEVSGVEEDGVYYYDVFVGSRNPSTRSPHTAEAALQPDGSMRVMVYSSKNLNFTGTEGDVAVLTTTAKAGTADGEYEFQIKNVILSDDASTRLPIDDYTGYITVNNGTTGIDAIDADAANGDAAIYDLQGRKVTETVKGGIYIKDGKKFIAE